MLVLLAAATVAAASPSGVALSPAEAQLQQQIVRMILAHPERYCKAAVASAATAGPNRPVVRCRPTPYYMADRGERPKPERLVITGSRVAVRDTRPPRDCLLMEGPEPASDPQRIAD